MPPSITLFAALVLAGALLGAALVLPAMGRVRRLRGGAEAGSTDRSGRDGPSVTVVVAARDEADSIEPALRSLLGQAGAEHGSRVRVVVVDDRSTDGTTEILARLSAESDDLEVVRVDVLPPGWLGKNHALQRGADAAGDAEFVLFTDADVVFAPGAVRAIARFAEREGLDHLTGAPRVEARSFALAGMIASFGVLFALFTRPWRVRDPKSSAAVGIGALNLVRRAAYERAGGHGTIRMRIDDDLSLGRLMKQSTGRSEFVLATDDVSLEWYPTLGAMLKGLHKNAFAGIEYRLSVAVLATAFIAAAFLAPFVLPFVTGIDATARVLAGVAAATLVLGASRSAARADLPLSAGVFFPVGMTLFLFVLWRSAIGALTTRRVVWRGTAYRLDELRASRDRKAA